MIKVHTILLPLKRIEYYTLSKKVSFYIDVYYFSKMEKPLHKLLLIRKNVNLKKKACGFKLPPLMTDTYRIIEDLKGIYTNICSTLENATIDLVSGVRKLFNPFYRMIGSLGLIPQKILLSQCTSSITSSYSNLTFLKSLLEKELEINNIRKIVGSDEILWYPMKLEVSENRVVFKEVDNKVNMIYSKLYEVDIGFKNATNSIINLLG